MGITNFIGKILINYTSEKSFAFKLRKKRAQRLIHLIDKCYNTNNEVTIIDIGGTKRYWNIIPREYLLEKNVHITVVNLPSNNLLPENDNIFTFLNGDGCNLNEFGDKSFHIAHSNSVIEHVGSWENMQLFAKEVKRVSDVNYLQTPNYWFPIEPHFVTPFFQWLPVSFRIKLVQNFNLGWFKKARNFAEARSMVDSCALLTKKQLIYLFPEFKIYNEHIACLIKSVILIKE